MVDINQNDWISYLKLITKWAFVNSQTVLIIKSQQQFPFFTRPKSQKSSYTCAFSLLSNHSVLKWFTRGGTHYLLPLSVQADIFFPSIASQTQKQGAQKSVFISNSIWQRLNYYIFISTFSFGYAHFTCTRVVFNLVLT